ncbi:unnamed protein product [Paramecium primaurelia]|uniref:RNase H type-1 domain-containing protein n=1 Tax=Paramecium primaurelia TaxID=5886 RepID=A0A8S1JWT6_PARPR|nr:unnamed protein product [Paramecium primaurelia]
MGDNQFYSWSSSLNYNQIKTEQQDSYSEISRISNNQQSHSFSQIIPISQMLQNPLNLSDLDNQHKEKICYFNPLQRKINIDPQEPYELYYASSTYIQGRFGIIIKNQSKDLVMISQSFPNKKINELEFLATIHGMRYCIDLGIKILNVKGNSQLVTKFREFKLQGELAIYSNAIHQYSKFFQHIHFLQIPKETNYQAKQLSREQNDFVKVLIDQSQINYQSNPNDQNYSQILSSQQNINNFSSILQQEPPLNQIILEYQDIFSEYNKLSIKPINLDQNRDYALIFGKVNDNTNRGANFMITQDLNEIVIGTFYFPIQKNALQEISLLYGMRFLLECKITYLNCFTIDEIFCQLFEKESHQLKQSQIKEQRCLYCMKQLFQKSNCKTIPSVNQLKALKEPYQNKQSRFQILDETILLQNGKAQKYQSKTFQKFQQIYNFNG